MKKYPLSLIGNEAVQGKSIIKIPYFTEKMFLLYTRLLIQLFICNIGKGIALTVAWGIELLLAFFFPI